MARLSREELDKIKEKYNVSRIWSFSRINAYETSKYEYALRYLMHEPEDRQDCAYTTLGSLCHDTLDDFYEGKISYDDMAEQFTDGWITAIDIAGLKLDRNDEEHDAKLKEKYKFDIQHFFKNHVTYDYKLLIEKPVITKVGSSVFVGYCDAIYKDDEGYYYVVDFKTSSASGFSGNSLEKKSMQLILYSMALIQSGVDIEHIRPCFNMLKYVNVETTLKNGKKKVRQIERCSIGQSLQSNCKTWLKAFDYSEDEIDNYLKMLLDTNSIEILPEEVQEKYKFEDCHIYVPLTQELVDKTTDTIINIVRDIMAREKDYKETGSDQAFWDDEASVKKESYYYATLCGYSPSKLLPYKAYLDQLEKQKRGMDFFGGVGNDSENNVVTNNDICNNGSTDEVDLSWLDEIA